MSVLAEGTPHCVPTTLAKSANSSSHSQPGCLWGDQSSRQPKHHRIKNIPGYKNSPAAVTIVNYD